MRSVNSVCNMWKRQKEKERGARVARVCGRDEEGARATVTPCRLHVCASTRVCIRVCMGITLAPYEAYASAFPYPLGHTLAPSNRASLTSRYFLAEGNIPTAFYRGRNKAGCFFVVDRNASTRLCFMTAHLISGPIEIWKTCFIILYRLNLDTVWAWYC